MRVRVSVFVRMHPPAAENRRDQSRGINHEGRGKLGRWARRKGERKFTHSRMIGVSEVQEAGLIVIERLSSIQRHVPTAAEAAAAVARRQEGRKV